MPLAVTFEATFIGHPRLQDVGVGDARRGYGRLLRSVIGISGVIVVFDIDFSAGTLEKYEKKRSKCWNTSGNDDIVDFVATGIRINELTLKVMISC